jgi:phosphohistidine phosphatase SixA
MEASMRVTVTTVLVALSWFLGTFDANASNEAAWRALKERGTVAVIRHANAPGYGDPDDFELGDCSTQRTLDDVGRAQARAIGEAFGQHDIAVDRVLTSQWCRCRNTAELMDVAPVEDFPPLNSFFEDRSTGDQQTRRTREFLVENANTEKLVLVTHAVNISALTGTSASEGEIIVVDVRDDGSVTVEGEIRLER